MARRTATFENDSSILAKAFTARNRHDTPEIFSRRSLCPRDRRIVLMNVVEVADGVAYEVYGKHH